MDFGLSPEQSLLSTTVGRWAAGECPTSRVRRAVESVDGHDRELWRSLAAIGVTGLTIPEAHGGAGLEVLELALVAEQLGRFCVPGPFLAHAMATTAIIASGHADAATRWLVAAAAGEAVLGMALGEDVGMWEPASVTTTFRDGGLHGEKPLVAAADVADAIVVAARDETGPGLWLVERGAPQLTITPLAGNDGTRRVARVGFAGTPALRIATGTAAAERARDVGLVLLAADAFGGAWRCLEMTRDYALTREQFGQTIAHFQGVKHQLADLAARLAPACSLWWYAAHALDHIPERAARHAALAKSHLTELFDDTARASIELHGGIGFTWEYDLQLWFRRALFDRAYLGEARLQRERAADLAGWTA